MSDNRAIQALGEIALRVDDLDVMQHFYESVIGLELLRRFPTSAFFRLGAGYAGHTQVLALFDRTEDATFAGLSARQTTVDHLAFTIALGDYVTELERLRALGLQVDTTTHPWVQWRSLYVTDPEGNRVELVCFDGSIPRE